MTEMTERVRAHYDAQADHEAWAYAHEIMEPWMEVVRLAGSGELTKVMEGAFAEVEREVGRSLDVLEDYQSGVEPAGSYRSVLERISRHHGFSGAEEVARRASELYPSYPAAKLLDSPSSGFGHALDAVLHMNESENIVCLMHLAGAFCRQSSASLIGLIGPGYPTRAPAFVL